MRILTILQAALAVCGLAGCGRGAEPVVLGAVYDLTGGHAELDLPSSRGARLAVDETNRAGGVLGRPVALELLDGRSDPETLRRVTGELLADEPGPVALFGLSDTDMVLAAAPVAAEHGRLFVTSGATSPRLPGEVPEYLFLACFGDNAQAAAGAEHAYRSLGARRAVVLFDGTMTYTRLLHRYFEERFQALGGEVAASREYGDGDLESLLDELAEADLVYLAAGPEDVERGIRLLRGAGVVAPGAGGRHRLRRHHRHSGLHGRPAGAGEGGGGARGDGGRHPAGRRHRPVRRARALAAFPSPGTLTATGRRVTFRGLRPPGPTLEVRSSARVPAGVFRE
jgi:branched-chain amino acid transport system substrate-binding protein